MRVNRLDMRASGQHRYDNLRPLDGSGGRGGGQTAGRPRPIKRIGRQIKCANIMAGLG